MNKRLLLIFAKQARKGKVKTRLARTIGDDKALAIYNFLLQHSAYETSKVKADRWVIYSPDIEEGDAFDARYFSKFKQSRGDLGQRMLQAFQDGFAAGYQQVILIGSDIYELQTAVIERAFGVLNEHDVVFGPARDGGYYLVGMHQPIPAIFLNKTWSHAQVLEEALSTLKQLNYSYALVDELNDIDEEKDLPIALRQQFGL